MSEMATSGAKASESGTSEAATGADAGRVIERVEQFDAPIEKVWRAISDRAELSKWFGDETRLDLVPGSEGAMIWKDHGSFALKVESVDPPHRLVWSWVHEPDVAFADAPSTRVEWSLSSRDDGGTTLHLRESGFLTDLHHEQNTTGWAEELAKLIELMAGQAPDGPDSPVD